jgi:hypothetical protein
MVAMPLLASSTLKRKSHFHCNTTTSIIHLDKKVPLSAGVFKLYKCIDKSKFYVVTRRVLNSESEMCQNWELERES